MSECGCSFYQGWLWARNWRFNQEARQIKWVTFQQEVADNDIGTVVFANNLPIERHNSVLNSLAFFSQEFPYNPPGKIDL